MTRASWGSKLRAGLLGSLIGILPGCASFQRPVPAEALPRRAVLALDGLDYRDVMEARQRGRFAAFHPPARLVSTFPSISDIAWHAIFGVYPPAGYQRVYYSNRHNAVLGDALSAIRPIEYEERMDYAFDTKFHHLGAYLMSWPVARGEVNTDVTSILRTRHRETVYLYNVGPDALQHTRGDVQRYLDHLDDGLSKLLTRYRERTGRELELVVLSDHGHNRARDAEFAPVVEALAAQGFESAKTISRPNQVAFSVDGVTTGFGVFCATDSVQRVATLLVELPSVDMVTRRVNDSLFTVMRRDSSGVVRLGSIHRRTVSGEERFRYASERSDPLELDSAVQQMRAAGAVDAEGFAGAAAWVNYTAAARYPVSPVRIVHGHLHAARNPAPILVSINDRFRVGLGMVSMANRLRPLGGTHGALGSTNAVGVVMSNSVVPHDDVAMLVRHQFGGFDDLLDLRVHEPSITVVDARMLRADRLLRRPWGDLAALPDSGPVVLLSLPKSPEQWSGAGGRFRVEVRALDRDGPAHRALLPLAAASRRIDGTQWAWPAAALGLATLSPGQEYRIAVVLEQVRGTGDGTIVDRSKTVLSTRLRAALDGVPWSY
jgi:hypothetical protein